MVMLWPSRPAINVPVEPLYNDQECLTKFSKHLSLQIMFILPLMIEHLSWKTAVVCGFYKEHLSQQYSKIFNQTEDV